ncbi:MAG: hypothetical protein HC834_08065 [Rhodospirillales bacterium]|nr:hypothetical protein [Rhodospirillales bacterium]
MPSLLPENDIVDFNGKVVRKGTGLQTLDQRITALQNDQQLQRQFFMGGDGFTPASFEEQSKASIYALLTDPSSTVARKYRDAKGTIQPDLSLVQNLDERMANARFLGFLTEEKGLASRREDYYLTNTEASRRSLIRDEVQEAITAR